MKNLRIAKFHAFLAPFNFVRQNFTIVDQSKGKVALEDLRIKAIDKFVNLERSKESVWCEFSNKTSRVTGLCGYFSPQSKSCSRRAATLYRPIRQDQGLIKLA